MSSRVPRIRPSVNPAHVRQNVPKAPSPVKVQPGIKSAKMEHGTKRHALRPRPFVQLKDALQNALRTPKNVHLVRNIAFARTAVGQLNRLVPRRNPFVLKANAAPNAPKVSHSAKVNRVIENAKMANGQM